MIWYLQLVVSGRCFAQGKTHHLNPTEFADKLILFVPQTLSNEKKIARWGYIADEILPSYVGIIVNHYKKPY